MPEAPLLPPGKAAGIRTDFKSGQRGPSGKRRLASCRLSDRRRGKQKQPRTVRHGAQLRQVPQRSLFSSQTNILLDAHRPPPPAGSKPPLSPTRTSRRRRKRAAQKRNTPASKKHRARKRPDPAANACEGGLSIRHAKKSQGFRLRTFPNLVGEGGFEPPKS